MSEEQLAAFVEDVNNDKALQEALKAATSAEDVVALAAAQGFTITAEDLVQQGAQMADAELESVAGGREAPYVTWTAWPYCPPPTGRIVCR